MFSHAVDKTDNAEPARAMKVVVQDIVKSQDTTNGSLPRELGCTESSRESSAVTRWAIVWATIALVLSSMSAAVTWAYKAHLTQQQAALTIGSAVFLGAFIIAGVVVRISSEKTNEPGIGSAARDGPRRTAPSSQSLSSRSVSYTK